MTKTNQYKACPMRFDHCRDLFRGRIVNKSSNITKYSHEDREHWSLEFLIKKYNKKITIPIYYFSIVCVKMIDCNTYTLYPDRCIYISHQEFNTLALNQSMLHNYRSIRFVNNRSILYRHDHHCWVARCDTHV